MGEPAATECPDGLQPTTEAAIEPEEKEISKRTKRRRAEAIAAEERHQRKREQREVTTVDAKEDAAVTEIELLENAIIWCRTFLPKDAEQKIERAEIEYNA